MKWDVARVQAAVANSPPAVRVGVTAFALLLVVAMTMSAGTSIGRAIYYLSH